MRANWLILVVAVLLVLCIFQSRPPEAIAADGSGSYQIYSGNTPDVTLLLDSQSGRTWELANNRRGLEWQPIRRR